MIDQPQSRRTSLAPLSPDSQTRQVMARLLDYFMDDELAPGSRLPSERQLADALQVGRSAIRETLAALEVLGIIDSRPGAGTYLRNDSSDLLPTVINWGLSLGKSRTLDLVEARAELEVVTVRLAAERANDEDVAKLKTQLDLMKDARASLNEFIDADVNFHLEIADMAGNTVLDDILHSVRSLLHVWVDRAVRAEGETGSTVREHQRVYNAIRRRDPDAAVEAMRKHMHSASDRLRLSLEQGVRSG